MFNLSSRLKWLSVIKPRLSKRAATTDYKKVFAAYHSPKRSDWFWDAEFLLIPVLSLAVGRARFTTFQKQISFLKLVVFTVSRDRTFCKTIQALVHWDTLLFTLPPKQPLVYSHHTAQQQKGDRKWTKISWSREWSSSVSCLGPKPSFAFHEESSWFTSFRFRDVTQ